ncbi:MAG: anti-sigma factor, partial [Salinisphaera sp.]|nr:anti-sigma factor [Salinisphaera sp.]
DLQAAEYALGLLSEMDTRAFARRLRQEPGLGAALESWQKQLAELGMQLAPVTPRSSVWRRVMLRTSVRPQRRQLVLWRALAAAASVAALAMGVLLYSQQSQAPQAPRYASLIRDDTLGVGWLITPGRHRDQLVVSTLGEYRQRQDKALELWLLPPGGQPVSLGLLPRDGTRVVHLPIADAHGLSNLATLAISIEPKGGSPTGRPTGETLAIAPVTAEFDTPYLASLSDQL